MNKKKDFNRFFRDFKNLLMKEFEFLQESDFKVFGSTIFSQENSKLDEGILKRFSDFKYQNNRDIGDIEEEEQDMDILLSFHPLSKHRGFLKYGDEPSRYQDLLKLLRKYFFNFEEIRATRTLLKFKTLNNVSIDVIINNTREIEQNESNWNFLKEYFHNEVFPEEKNRIVYDEVKKHRKFFIKFNIELKNFLKGNHLYKYIFGYLNSISLLVFNLCLFKKIKLLHKFRMWKCFMFFFHYFVEWDEKKKIIQLNKHHKPSKKNKNINKKKRGIAVYQKTKKGYFPDPLKNVEEDKIFRIFTPIENNIILRNLSFWSKKYMLMKFKYFVSEGKYDENYFSNFHNINNNNNKNQENGVFFQKEKNENGKVFSYFKIKIFGEQTPFLKVLAWKGYIISKIISFVNEYYFDSYYELYGENVTNEEDLKFLDYVLVFPKCVQRKKKFYIFMKMKLNKKVFIRYFKRLSSKEYTNEKKRISENFIQKYNTFRVKKLMTNNGVYTNGLETEMVEFFPFGNN